MGKGAHRFLHALWIWRYFFMLQLNSLQHKNYITSLGDKKKIYTHTWRCDSFHLPVPICTVETTLGGFSNCMFKHYCAHVGPFFYFTWWLLKEPFVCVKGKIYSKNVYCKDPLIKTCVITICLRELLLYCQHDTF